MTNEKGTFQFQMPENVDSCEHLRFSTQFNSTIQINPTCQRRSSMNLNVNIKNHAKWKKIG